MNDQPNPTIRFVAYALTFLAGCGFWAVVLKMIMK